MSGPSASPYLGSPTIGSKESRSRFISKSSFLGRDLLKPNKLCGHLVRMGQSAADGSTPAPGPTLQGNNSSMRLTGWSAIRSITYHRQASGSRPIGFVVPVSV